MSFTDEVLLNPEHAFDPPISTDPDEIREEMYDRMRLRVPGWEPVPGNPLTHLFAVAAETTAESRAALVQRFRSEMLTLVGERDGVPRQLGAPARATITIRAADRLGHELPAGSTVAIGDVECETVTALVLEPGADEGSVLVQAVELGSQANGADGEVQVDAHDWIAVDGVTLDEPLADGIDPETDADYSWRVAQERQLTTKTPITPPNWVVIALRHPRVGHAWVLDTYDPGDPEAEPEPIPPSWGNPRHLTVVVATLLGEPLEQTDLDEIHAELRSVRESTFEHHVLTVTLVPVDAELEVLAHAGFDLEQVEASVGERIRQVLSPAPWVASPYGRDPSYVPTALVHRNELIAQADRVLGADIITDAIVGDGRTDSVRLGPLELPTPGTIRVTAIAPTPPDDEEEE